MNDQNLIWEAYENSKKPWDENFKLLKGIKLSNLSTSELSEYFDNLDVILGEDAKDKYEYPSKVDPRDPEDWIDPKEPDDNDLDVYMWNRFNFELDDLKNLESLVKGREDYNEYFSNGGISSWINSVIHSVRVIVEYDMNPEDDYGGPDDDISYDRIRYNPYDR